MAGELKISFLLLNTRNHISGGWGGSQANNNAYMLIYQVWTLLNPMTARRSLLACAEYKGEIYAMGGNADNVIDSTEIYSLTTGQWRNGPTLPYANNFGQGLNYGGSLYLIGGSYQSGNVLKLNKDENAWVQVIDTAQDATLKAHPAPIITIEN